MAALKILRSHYKALTHGNLAVFALNVYQKMSSQPEYAAYAADIALLGQQVTAYSDALAEAVAGGVDRTARKKECLATLYLTLDRLVDQLNLDHTGQASWGINAGMALGHGKRRFPMELPAPTDLKVQATGISGEAMLRYKMSEPRRVTMNMVEYSLDEGNTWKIAEAASRSCKIRLKDLPTKQTIWFRVRSTGAAQRVSAWTESVALFVI
jgi:hypothetical protein